MSAPRIIIQILIVGSQIFGKALFEAGRQAVRNAKHRPVGGTSDVAGVSNATSGSITDKLTRDYRMTLDEAHLILNLKAGETIEQVLKSYEHLFQANGPPPAAKEAPRQGTRGSAAAPQSSHYLQSKVVRARERIEAEMKLAEESPPPPPPDPTKQDP